jgi:hypothetical protein
MGLVSNFDKETWSNSVGSTEDVLQCPADTTLIVIGFKVANVSASGLTASVKLYDAAKAASYHLVKDAPIPVGGSLTPNNEDKLVLHPGDKIQITPADSSSSLEAVISYMKISI